ncbi:metallophosphoesterase family protein [Streptomyces carpinensis]|uniref:Metallophosphoesterase n=1 Tax=Streptomyces carpinensis TaxID=66369 RepID=A0ABV1WAH6_9ACTN|nr:metallophosphoesterase [Streptomyces carpinensis]
MRRRTLAASAAAVGGVLLLAATANSAVTEHNPWPYDAPSGKTAVLAAVGDISCEPDGDAPAVNQKYLCNDTKRSAQAATADQIEALQPDLVALLGDQQYQVGRYDDFMGSFDRTYGAFKYLQRPVPGNHEFYDYKDGEKGVDGAGYYAYYNGLSLDGQGNPLVDAQGQPIPRTHGQAGTTGEGWYSYDLGAWHIISLNAECKDQAGGCSPDGDWVKQETEWLRQDLADDHAPCTLAYWHQPAFTAMDNLSDEGRLSRSTWWPMLYRSGVDVVLNAHEHLYARFAPQDPDGRPDPKKGISQFVVGTGGEALDTLAPAEKAPNRVTGNDTSYGVIRFSLQPTGYTWSYRAANGTDYTDEGSARCHGPVND